MKHSYMYFITTQVLGIFHIYAYVAVYMIHRKIPILIPYHKITVRGKIPFLFERVVVFSG